MNPSQDPDRFGVQPPTPVHQPPSTTMFPDPSLQDEVTPVQPTTYQALGTQAPATQQSTLPDSPQAQYQQPDYQQPPAMLPYPFAPKKSRRRAVFVTALAVAAVLLIGGGAVFGLYIPNQPNNVFKTGLDRSGMAMDKLVTAGTQQQQLTQFQNSELTGTVEVASPDKTYSGTISTRYDKNQSDTSLGYKTSTPGVATADGQDFSAQVLSDLAAGKTYPDIYFKLTGLLSIGADTYIPGLSAYDGKWISVSSDYITSIIPAQADTTTTDTTAKKSDFTAADAAALSKIVTTITRDYLLTSNPAKAVLVQKSFKGTEKFDGAVTANHYVVGINKTNAKAYCAALVGGVVGADAFKRLPSAPTDNLDKVKQDTISSCQKSIDNDLKDSDTFDMWVDKKTKLIHKVRFTDDTDKTLYVEVGQNYTSGNRIPIFANYHSDKQKFDATFTLDVDMDSGITKGSVQATDSSAGTWSVKADLTFKPYKGDVKITKPINALPIKTVLDKLGLSPDGTTDATKSDGNRAVTPEPAGSLPAKAADTERQTDLRSLQSQLEAYYAGFGSYPTLTEVNSASWRATNMKGLSSSALADPAATGASSLLATAAHSGQYGYLVSKCNSYGVACQAYTLTAILSTTGAFSLKSLN